MKQTSRNRLRLRPLIFTALLMFGLSAGLTLRGDGPLRTKVSAQQAINVVNAASFTVNVAPGSIAAAFGSFVTQNNQSYSAQTRILPTTLGGVSVKIANVDAGLFFVGPTQINLLIPAGLPDKADTNITVTNSDNTTRTATFSVVSSAPGVFTVGSSGGGLPAAYTIDSAGLAQSVFNPDLSPRDVSAGTKDLPNRLILFTTGVRGPAASVTVKFQGVTGVVEFAGPSPEFTGIVQINVIIPAELSGLGLIRIVVSENGSDSNRVSLKLGGQIPPVRLTQITPGQTINGELTTMDQVQFVPSTGDTFFFDAYDFTTTAPNTSVAVDLRSAQFDATVLIYRVENDNTLTFLAADDESGQYPREDIHDALLLTVLPTVSRYVIFASSSDVEPNGVGQYALKLLTNVITPISYGQTVNGAIASTDLQTSGGTFLDVYSFNGAAGDRQQILMRSTALNSFLILQPNEEGFPIAADDNSGGGNDALIDPTHGLMGFPLLPFLPQTGVYIILATPLDATVTSGAYTLTLNKMNTFNLESESGVNLTAPGRRMGVSGARAADSGGTTFERLGRRLIRQQ